MKKNTQFVIIGMGKFGQAIATTLLKNGFDVLCCDKNVNIVNQLEEFIPDIVRVDITDESAFSKLGIGSYDVAVVAIGNSLEACVMATMYAKEAGVGTVIVKAQTYQQKRLLERVGADKVIMPEVDSGERLAIRLVTSNIIDYISFSDEYAIAEVMPKKEWINKSLVESNIRAKYGYNVVAVKNGSDVIVSPSANFVVESQHILVIIGESAKIQNYEV